MSCLGAIGRLFVALIIVAALLVLGVIVLAIFQAAKQPEPAGHHAEAPSVAAERRPEATVQPSAPMPTPAPTPPPSVEERINIARERLGLLTTKAKDALKAATDADDPESALRQVKIDLESIADGPEGANAIANQLKEELSQISEKTQSIRANTLLSYNDKNELAQTLAGQQVVVQKALADADNFCRSLRSIQTKDIPAWMSTYSHFASILGPAEALKKISSRIESSASTLGGSAKTR